MPHLRDLRARGVCAGQEALRRTQAHFHAHRLRDGPAEAGHPYTAHPRCLALASWLNTLSAVVHPIVGGRSACSSSPVCREHPQRDTEAAVIDGASELKTFNRIVFPMIKPGVGALAIFTFINSWNDYFMQLIMLSSTKNLTISLGIAKMAENSTDSRLIMAGAAFAAVPIIIVFHFPENILPRGSRWALSRADTQGVKTMKARDLNKYQDLPCLLRMLRRRRRGIARPCTGVHGIPHREGCKRPLCRRFVR